MDPQVCDKDNRECNINTILTVYNTTNILQNSIADHLYAQKMQLQSNNGVYFRNYLWLI